MHWHSTSYHEFQGSDEQVVEFVFGYVGEATKKAKVFMCSHVLGCLKACNCWFDVKFVLSMVNHQMVQVI